MTDQPQEEVALPPFIIEGARSSRSRCKTCRRKIDKGALRIGILIEGPYGAGHLWHHLRCAARRQFEKVEEAYGLEAWNMAKQPPEKVPDLESLRALREQAEQRKKELKEIPHAEVAPSARSKCQECGETIDKGAMRVVLGRLVEFGQQVRTAPIKLHPHCVRNQMQAEDCATEADGFESALRHNSRGLSPDQLDAVLAAIGNPE